MESKFNPTKYAQTSGKLFKVDYRRLESGNSVATVTMGLSNGKDEKTGEWRPSTFIDWVLWGEQADAVANLQKGDFISLKGNISHQEWLDKNTQQKRSKIIFKAVQISLDPAKP